MAEETKDPLKLFSEEIRIPVYGLAALGHLTKKIEFCGHSFTLKTLRPSERAAAAMAAKPWRETLVEPEVWANAQVALAVTSVDGDHEFCIALGPDLEDFARSRLNYVTDPNKGWSKPTLAFLYEEYLSVEDEALTAINELRNLSRASLASLQAGLDSSSEADTLDALTASDIPLPTTSSKN